jgi:hypothetical protein
MSCEEEDTCKAHHVRPLAHQLLHFRGRCKAPLLARELLKVVMQTVLELGREIVCPLLLRLQVHMRRQWLLCVCVCVCVCVRARARVRVHNLYT